MEIGFGRIRRRRIDRTCIVARTGRGTDGLTVRLTASRRRRFRRRRRLRLAVKRAEPKIEDEGDHHESCLPNSRACRPAASDPRRRSRQLAIGTVRNPAPGQMADLLALELERRGFERKGDVATRRNRDVVVSVELDTGVVTVKAQASEQIRLEGESTGTIYEEQRRTGPRPRSGCATRWSAISRRTPNVSKRPCKNRSPTSSKHSWVTSSPNSIRLSTAPPPKPSNKRLPRSDKSNKSPTTWKPGH